MTKDWNPIEHAVDYVILAGQKSPGICEVVGASAPRNWDIQKGYALSGAWLVYTGDGLAKFSLRFKLYTRADWVAWWAFQPVLAKRPTFVFDPDRPIGIPKEGLSIWHPFLDALGIAAVVVEEEMQPVLSDETGEWTIEVKLIQFRKPRKAFAKPVAAMTTTAPEDVVEQRILSKEAIRDGLTQELARPGAG